MHIGAQEYPNRQRKRASRIRGVDELLTEAELAQLLKVSVGTIRRWRAEGTGPPALRLGRGVRYRRAAGRSIDACVDACGCQPAGERTFRENVQP
ncbi:MAG: helix-turn-helix transcriptional regulator [Actinomycetota bacterium]